MTSKEGEQTLAPEHTEVPDAAITIMDPFKRESDNNAGDGDPALLGVRVQDADLMCSGNVH